MAAVESLLRNDPLAGHPRHAADLADACAGGPLIQRIRRPAGEMLAVMGELAGHREARITGEMGHASSRNWPAATTPWPMNCKRAVANQAEAAESLKTANAALSRNADTLRERGEVIEILGAWPTACRPPAPTRNWPQSSRSSCARAAADSRRAVRAQQFAQSLGAHGHLGWAGASADGFRAECWALRRGQSHFVDEAGSDIVCPHVVSGPITTIASRWPAEK
jgi:hypothetical protein